MIIYLIVIILVILLVVEPFMTMMLRDLKERRDALLAEIQGLKICKHCRYGKRIVYWRTIHFIYCCNPVCFRSVPSPEFGPGVNHKRVEIGCISEQVTLKKKLIKRTTKNVIRKFKKIFAVKDEK